ncbi:hypothetical protein PAXRUDRAFT_21532 [Paxillus rubicundulus Ve08.2h10]|uniref:Uncharacterized protein n=1 Tax=Paxillus rubicundulus Ve08.2h10 TaxID=930991 RepID=A0A0D0BME9_9AGAM|nr:hypothetical protein PAXRUDRAFT_21532 [Paxillus rubicundulus Ve08.2h10]
MPGASHGTQLLALVQPKSAPSTTTASDAPAATPTTSQGVPPPPSGPPSAPPSIPEPPQVIHPPIELPSSTVGQDKGKQHADEPPWPWDDVNIDSDVDVDVDMDMGCEEDLYKDDVDVDTNFYRGQKRLVSLTCLIRRFSHGMPFSSESTSNLPTAATSTLKHSKTMVLTWETIRDILDKGMAAIDDDKAHSSSFKLEKLHLKFDHACFTEERSLDREQCVAEQLNATVVHQQDQEQVEPQIQLRNSESDAFEHQTQMFLAQAELLRLQQGMAKGQE